MFQLWIKSMNNEPYEFLIFIAKIRMPILKSVSSSLGRVDYYKSQVALNRWLDYNVWPDYFFAFTSTLYNQQNILSCLPYLQGGLVYLDEPLSIFDYKNDRQKWKDTLAKQKTAWPAGESQNDATLSTCNKSWSSLNRSITQ